MGRIHLAAIVMLAVSACSASFERPWEDRGWVAANPNIWTYGNEYWWGIPSLHNTLEGAKFDEAKRAGAEGEAQKRISDAASYADKAGKDRNLCYGQVVYAIGIFPSYPSIAFMNLFSDSSGCMSYKNDWKMSVENVLLSLELSLKESQDAVSGARRSYEGAQFMGLCGGAYSGPGSEPCPELESAFYCVDGNISEGKYGKYALLLEYSHSTEESLKEPVPNLSLYPAMLSLAYGEGGVLETFNEARRLSDEAKKTSESAFQSLSASASGGKSAAQTKIAALGAQRLDLIDRAPSGFDAREAGSVAENFKCKKSEAEELLQSYNDAKSIHGKTTWQGYMAKSLTLMSFVDDGYHQLIAELGRLEQDAQAATMEQKDDAEDEIQKSRKSAGSMGAEGSALLEDAQDAFESAGREAAVGKSYVLYRKAAAFARSARNAPTNKEEAEAASSVSKLKTLIELAQKDGIVVFDEKERLGLIESLPPAQSAQAAQECMQGIAAKARIKYDAPLIGARTRIYDKLEFAGDGAADLYTDMSRAEDGVFEGEDIDYPVAIGSLKRLASDYAKIESTLDGYMSEIVGNAMSSSASPLIEGVRLDEPAQIVLDAVLANPKPYGAEHVRASVSMDSAPAFLFSDIVSGKDSVESLRQADGGRTLIMSFPSVDAFETKRVIIEKNLVLAHVTKRQTLAKGIGNGAARVEEQIEFELDCDVPIMQLPDGMEGAYLDGSEALGPLRAGRHKIEYDGIMQDAYSESVLRIKAYREGLGSRVETDIRILPAIAMDSALVYFDSINGSHVKDFDIVAVTGEPVREKRRLSGTQFSASVFGLARGRETIVRFSYEVDDTESYVAERLSLMENENASDAAKALISEARIQHGSGNSSRALELLEQSVALSRTEQKEAAKEQDRYLELRKKLEDELSQIDSSLPGDSRSAFALKLSSRKKELEDVLSEANATDAASAAAILSKIDSKWLDKEMAALKKDIYKQYNGLKERLFKAGYPGTPAEFMAFEEDLNRLETGGKLSYAISAVAALEDAGFYVQARENETASSKEGQKAALSALESEARELFERYSLQASAAKGTDYSGMFVETEKKIDRLVGEADDAVGKDPRLFSQKSGELEKSMDGMEMTLESLEDESESKLSLLENAVSGMDESKKAYFRPKLDSMQSMISSGDYVNALRSGSAMTKEIESGKGPENNGIMILGLTALAALAGIGFYMFRKKPEKQLRKLTSFSQAPLRQNRPGPEGFSGHSSRSSPSPARKMRPRPEDSRDSEPPA